MGKEPDIDVRHPLLCGHLAHLVGDHAVGVLTTRATAKIPATLRAVSANAHTSSTVSARPSTRCSR